MSALTRLFGLRSIEAYVVRPLFVFVTFLFVLLAIVQASGRFAMYTLNLFEDQINGVLEAQNIRVQGVQGSWRGLNPVVRIDSVTFPAGFATHAEAELDLLESVFRSAWIPRRVNADLVEIYLEQTVQGWRLRGQGDQVAFDATELLRHGDHMSGQVHLHLANLAGAVDSMVAELQLLNHGQMHFARLDLRNDLDQERRLNAQFWQYQPLEWLNAKYNGAKLSGSVLLPSALTGFAGGVLEVQEAGWRDSDGLGGGAIAVQVDVPELPQTQATTRLQVALGAQRDGQRVAVKTEPSRLTVSDDVFPLGPIYINMQIEDQRPLALSKASELLEATPTPPALSLWTSELDLSRVSAFVGEHFGGLRQVSEWVKNLAVSGTAHNVHGFIDPEKGMGYQALIADLRMRGYKGAPTIQDVEARVWGYQNGTAIAVQGESSFVQFPDLYRAGWQLANVQGVVKAWFAGGYLGLQGTHIKGGLEQTNVAGSFAISRPKQAGQQRLSLYINADEVGLLKAKSFVPYKIPDNLAQWLEQGPRGGQLSDARFAMHGAVRQVPGVLARRIELVSELSQGVVEYHPDWPLVQALEADLHMAGVDTHVQVKSATSLGVPIEQANLVLRDNASFAEGQLATRADAETLLNFVANSALQDTLGFITPQWSGSGPIGLAGELSVPINADKAPPLKVDLRFDLNDVDLSMPNYRVEVSALTGNGEFSLPHHLSGTYNSVLFGREAVIQARSDADWLHFDISGTATPEDVYALLGTRQSLPIVGEFDFDSVLNLAMTGGVTNLAVQTDLQKLEVGLPGVLAKSATEAVSSDLNVQFLADYQSVQWRYNNINGWLHYTDHIERGAIGFDTSPPMVLQDESAIIIGGHMPQLVLEQWVGGDGESAVSLPLDWEVRGLKIDEFLVGELAFTDLTLNGQQTGEEVSFGFEAPDVIGTLTLPSDEVMSLDLQQLRLPSMDDAPAEGADGTRVEVVQIDPISTEVGRSLPAAKVNLERLILGEEPFGAWRFQIQPNDETVTFSGFGTDVNGVHIEGGTLEWDLAQDRTHFEGAIELDDLIETLPKWDFAPSMSTSKATASADVSWQGSPLNVNLLGARGDLNFRAKEGRFVEVEAGGGGLRILSLLNFNKAVQRINFDFSDVVGQGLSFDKLSGSFNLNEGDLTFLERLKIEGSSGKYQVGGRVDLRNGELENEMIVTLPVSKSLPWYGVYLALANPIVGVGVMVGERVLRKPIEQFSTAKFEITGTFDDPKVAFVSIWDQRMKEVTPPPPVNVEEQENPVSELDNPRGEPTAQVVLP